MQTSKGERRLGSILWPSGNLLPGAKFLQALGQRPISAAVALLKFQDMQTLQMLLKCTAYQGGAIYLMPLRREVGGLKQPGVQNYLYSLHCGLCSTV